MSGLSRFIPPAARLLITVFLAASAKANTIESLVFTGTATCETADCSSFSSGPLTGLYSLDTTTQTIVGTWLFSTPFGVLSSSDAGAGAFLEGLGMETNGALFEEYTPTFFELVWLQFPVTDTQQIGSLTATPPPGFNQISTACQNSVIISGGCIEDYEVTGATTLAGIAPEPSSLAFFAVGMLALVGLNQRKALLYTRGLRLCRSMFGRGGSFGVNFRPAFPPPV